MIGLTKLAPGPGKVGLSERTEPSAAPSVHVILDVTAAGICGTDLHIYDGEFASRPPVTMGRESRSTAKRSARAPTPAGTAHAS